MVATGVVVGVASGTAAAETNAATLSAQGRYAEAIAIDDEIAGRTGPLYLLDPNAASQSAAAAEQTVMAWAAALGRAGEVDRAVALYRTVTAASLRGEALDALAALLFQSSATDAADAAYPSAIARLLEIRLLAPSTPAGIQAARQLPIDQTGEAGVLITAGQASDAVTILEAVVEEHSAQATKAADSLFPSALLAAGEEDITHYSFREALVVLEKLVNTFPSSAESAQAEAMLATPQSVTGTLVTHSGTPVSGRVRLSSNYKSEPDGSYQTSGPFYMTTADGSGDFFFTGIPIGGPYVLEVFSGGNWTTLINPATDQPADPVMVTPLVPVDLTFVVLPS